MGELERKARKSINKSKVQEAILVSIASGGRRGSSDLLPSVLNYFLDLDIPISSRKKDIIYSAVSRLRRKGLVEFKSGKYFLTTDGEKVLRQWEMDDYRIEIVDEEGKLRAKFYGTESIHNKIAQADFKTNDGTKYNIKFK